MSTSSSSSSSSAQPLTDSAPAEMPAADLSLTLAGLTLDSSTSTGDAGADTSASQAEIESLLSDGPVYPPHLVGTYAALTPGKVARDPVLAHLARQQRAGGHGGGEADTPAPFRARPAPKFASAGPRLTKAAALRMGVEWEKKAREPPASLPTSAPAHKRATSMATPVAALAQPAVAPKQNRAALLRAGIVPPAATKRDAAQVAAELAAGKDAERARRRQSFAAVRSLDAPAITPRLNKAAALRTAESVPRSGSTQTLSATKSNDDPDADSRVRRRSLAVAALGAPAIVPRANKASALRTQPVAPPAFAAFQSTPGLARSHSSSTLALGTSSAANVAAAAGVGAGARARVGMTTKERAQADRVERAGRRATLAGTLKSLGAPSIAPKLNKAAMLRTAPTSNPNLTPARPAPSSASASASASATSRPRSAGPRKSAAPAQPAAVKPTKASLLRAGLGAKVQDAQAV
ncbi:hypothetical protein Q5752_006031 [Cryptotrichosporon argae]